MPNISVSFDVSDDEKKIIEEYAEAYDIDISQALKRAFFERIEDLEDACDIRVIKEAEASGDTATYTHEEIGKMLGLKKIYV